MTLQLSADKSTDWATLYVTLLTLTNVTIIFQSIIEFEQFITTAFEQYFEGIAFDDSWFLGLHLLSLRKDEAHYFSAFDTLKNERGIGPCSKRQSKVAWASLN